MLPPPAELKRWGARNEATVKAKLHAYDLARKALEEIAEERATVTLPGKWFSAPKIIEVPSSAACIAIETLMTLDRIMPVDTRVRRERQASRYHEENTRTDRPAQLRQVEGGFAELAVGEYLDDGNVVY